HRQLLAEFVWQADNVSHSLQVCGNFAVLQVIDCGISRMAGSNPQPATRTLKIADGGLQAAFPVRLKAIA
ncbi:hypothetical protein, partial [Methylibium sp.]|uniref:hypothetical protein n=1 Tax=Methylibium sp. TaxID=2067992 RepID=UPI00286BAA55